MVNEHFANKHHQIACNGIYLQNVHEPFFKVHVCPMTYYTHRKMLMNSLQTLINRLHVKAFISKMFMNYFLKRQCGVSCCIHTKHS